MSEVIVQARLSASGNISADAADPEVASAPIQLVDGLLQVSLTLAR